MAVNFDMLTGRLGTRKLRKSWKSWRIALWMRLGSLLRVRVKVSNQLLLNDFTGDEEDDEEEEEDDESDDESFVKEPGVTMEDDASLAAEGSLRTKSSKSKKSSKSTKSK
jgi:hypothetical protein